MLRKIDRRRRWKSHRGLPRVTRDPIGADVSIEYDGYDLLPARVTDPVGLMTEASYDYRVLQASHITDPNGNLAEFRFSPAGLLAAQYLRGKNGEGDVANPTVRMEYDLLAFVNRGQRPRDGSQATAFRQTMSY